MKDINGVRFTLRERWEMVSHDLREDIAMYGLRQLVGGIVLFHWDKFTQPVRLSPVGTFIRKSRLYDSVAIAHLQTVDAYRETVQMCGELRAEVTRLQELESSWQSFYDWMNDEGRIQEHEVHVHESDDDHFLADPSGGGVWVGGESV